MADDERERALRDAERALQAAQRTSDVGELDRLLHPSLLAVGPDGRLVGKSEDLAAHRDGVYAIAALEEVELRVRLAGATGVTFVVLHIRGRVGNTDVDGAMRYTRTWTDDGRGWRVLAAHIVPAV